MHKCLLVSLLAATVLGAGVVAAGCGKKGPLYQPAAAAVAPALAPQG